MSVQFPDPAEVAAQQAEAIAANRFKLIDGPVQRVLRDSPMVNRDDLLAGLEAFHAERMAKIPSATRYPESPPWVEHTLAVDRELKQRAGLSALELAIYRSLHHYLTFRGFARCEPVLTEKCRIAYVPETDHGSAHIKNVDDPPEYHRFSKTGATRSKPAWRDECITMDGVGSGLHMDEEPEELFPLEPRLMMRHYAQDTPGAVEFLSRYGQFWGRANIIIYDRQRRSVTIEKCAYTQMHVWEPDEHGRSYVSGMTCRDPETPIGKHQQRMRDAYAARFGLPDDGSDRAFWAACRKFDAKLREGIAALGHPAKLSDLVDLFIKPWPEGLNKEGTQYHPQQPLTAYTLEVHMQLHDQRKYRWWVRDPETLASRAGPDEYHYPEA